LPSATIKRHALRIAPKTHPDAPAFPMGSTRISPTSDPARSRLPTGRSIRKRKRPKRFEGRPSPGFSVLTLRPSSFVGGLFRRLRWRASRWSASADREFHDTLFSSHQYDPFSFAYPGYLTIRRFAALASERLRIIGATRVADLGCGPGEITCELARTHPEIAFVGIDHSAAAIARAREHAARLGLANVTFRQEDVSGQRPTRTSF
jgi:hypothetical protein